MSGFEKNLNRVGVAFGIILITLVIMAMTSCGLTKPKPKFKKCCEKTIEEVYKHEGLRINK